MYAWLLLAFLCGAAAGGLAAWYLLKRRLRAPAANPAAARTPSPLPAPPGPEAPPESGHAVSSLSESSQRMLTDLERRYEGRQEAEPEAPKRRRKTRRPR